MGQLDVVGELVRARGFDLLLGFAIIDRQVGTDVTAVWLTTRVDDEQVGHTNAVCIVDTDPEREKKLRSLIADRAVILTTGSEPPLPLAAPLEVTAIDELLQETSAHQQRIREAVSKSPRGKGLVQPTFPSAPSAPNTSELRDAAQRALITANYLARVWTAWLAAEEQRRRRTIDPRTQTSPWLMPEDMNSPHIAEFPFGFSQRVRPEPLR